jgi:hypothetical protein
MAARRERERRKPPADRAYRFGTPEAALQPEDVPDETAAHEADEASARALEAASRRSRSARAAAVESQPAARGVRPVVHRPFSEFREEYAYVISDLRRVALVIGSMLVVLILLYFVLPH